MPEPTTKKAERFISFKDFKKAEENIDLIDDFLLHLDIEQDFYIYEEAINEAISKSSRFYKGTVLFLLSRVNSELNKAISSNQTAEAQLKSVARALKYITTISIINIAATTNDNTLVKRNSR